jgi:hypothetical protein
MNRETTDNCGQAPGVVRPVVDPARCEGQADRVARWVLDVTFNDDQSRLRKGFGTKNMAVVRHFALNLVRAANDQKSAKLRRKVAGWTPDCLDRILNERLE